MKLLSVVGARPQFVKAAVLSRELAKEGLEEVMVHTGQHYDPKMSQIFFEELEIAPPAYNLEMGGGGHGQMTGRMLGGIENVLLQEKPDAVIVYGDTNSTLAGALAAAKLHIPVVHVEAGLRSFNRRMPEEINRVLTDHISTLLFCPTEHSQRLLASEGITKGVYVVGDLMRAALAHAQVLAEREDYVAKRTVQAEKPYALLTCHRAENTDDPKKLLGILRGVAACPYPVFWPVHPRTRMILQKYGLLPEVAKLTQLRPVEPVGYVEMAALLKDASLVFTDSGGLQKEAFWSAVPCLTLRTETEWVETVETGWNQLVGTDEHCITSAIREVKRPEGWDADLYGKSNVAAFIVNILKEDLRNI